MKIFTINLPSQPFFAATLDFTSFFTIAFLGAAHFFTARLFWIRYHFFVFVYPKAGLWLALRLFKLIFIISLPQEEEKDLIIIIIKT